MNLQKKLQALIGSNARILYARGRYVADGPISQVGEDYVTVAGLVVTFKSIDSIGASVANQTFTDWLRSLFGH